MTMMAASFFTVASSSVSFRRTPYLSSRSPSPHLYSLPHLKKGSWRQEYAFIQVNCGSERSNQTDEIETEPASAPSLLESPSPSPLESPSTSATVDDDVSAYKWCAGLGGIGFLETTYLTYLKLTNSDAFCPAGGGSCSTILTSDYSYVFGIPLSLFGMLAYGLVATIGLQLAVKGRTPETGKTDGELILLGITTSMAVASVYFLYILNTEFVGELCVYCLASAILSFSLLFISLKSSRIRELQNVLGLQLFIATVVVIGLTASYNAAQPVSSRLEETEIPYFETEIATESTPLAISLAKHLHAIGAKLYGAFWCSHCLEQKEGSRIEYLNLIFRLLPICGSWFHPGFNARIRGKQIFGREAAKLLDYVECFPDGASKETKMAEACYVVKLEAFPTWVINGQVLTGEKQLSELAILSGFKPEDSSQSK